MIVLKWRLCFWAAGLVALSAGPVMAADPPMVNARDLVEFEKVSDPLGVDDWEAKGKANPKPVDVPAALAPENAEDCPETVVLYIHGYETTDETAKENTAQLATALGGNAPGGPVVAGFSWDSDVPGEPTVSAAFNNHFGAAEQAADKAGCELAKVLIALKKKCKDVKVHLVTHSLGARVALVALGKGACACSVQAIVPAVPLDVFETMGKEQSGGGAASGKPCVPGAHKFKIWINPKDEALCHYNTIRRPNALGKEGGKIKGKYKNVEVCKGWHKRKTRLYPDPREHGIESYFKSPRFIRCLKRKL